MEKLKKHVLKQWGREISNNQASEMNARNQADCRQYSSRGAIIDRLVIRAVKANGQYQSTSIPYAPELIFGITQQYEPETTWTWKSQKSANLLNINVCTHTSSRTVKLAILNKHRDLRSRFHHWLTSTDQATNIGKFEMQPILPSKSKDIWRKDYYWGIHINLATMLTTAAIRIFQLVENSNNGILIQLTSNRATNLGTH